MLKWSKKLILALPALVLALAMGLPVLAAAPQDAQSKITQSEPAQSETTQAEPAVVEEAAVEPEPEIELPAEAELPPEEAVEEEPPEEKPVEEEPTEEEPLEEETEKAKDDEDAESDETEETDETAEPYGLELSADSIVVGTWAELKRALGEENTYTTVYLGANIAAESSSAPIHAGKLYVVIDGSPPDGGRYTLTQYPTNGTGGILLVDDTATATTAVTLRNLDIVGQNDYGVVWVSNSITTVAITLENVNYTGPQPLNHRNGTVRFIGGSYTLTGGELAEALHAELGGTLRVDVTAGGNAVLWLVSTASTLRVLENADVSINTKNYLVYGTIADVTMEANAGLSLASKWFGFSFAGDSVGAFTLAGGARLDISLETGESYAALRVSRRFEMMPGSSATIVRTGTAGIPLRLTAPGAQAVFNQPHRVLFYSGAGVPLRFTGAGTLSITTSALNVWGKTAWPLAGGMGALPTHIWNKAGGAPLSLTGTYNEAANSRLEHNLSGGDPVVSELTAKTFNLEGSQLLALGSIALGIDQPTGQSTAITGGADAAAELLAAYTLADGQGGQTGGSADMAGRYSLPVSGGALLAGSNVAVTARANQLFIRQSQAVQDADNGTLSFSSVPQSIGFGTLQIPDSRGTVPPAQEGLQITVQDDRPAQAPWRIDAILAQPMAAQTSRGEQTLPGALLFKTQEGETLALNESPQTVYSHSGGTGGEITLAWEGGSGVLFNLVPGEVFNNAEYTATINWMLVDAP